MTNIYKLPYEIENTLDLYYSCFDEDGVFIEEKKEQFQEIEKKLFELQNQKNEIIEWYLKSRANNIAEISGLKTEIERLQKRVKNNEKKIETIEKIVDHNFRNIYDGKPTILGNFTISYRKSEGVIIENENIVPNEYKKEKIVFSIDKMEIKKDIKNGKKVDGAIIEERLNLNIK